MELDRLAWSHPNAGTPDPAGRRKHAEMLDRLSNLHQSRSSGDAAAASPAFESVSPSRSLLSDRERSLEADLQPCLTLAARESGSRLQPAPDEVAAYIADLDRLVAENSYSLPLHQIRIRQAKVSDFYLRLWSRLIIEDGSWVRFAPYPLFCQLWIKDDPKTGNWRNVDDFKWLRAVQSPIWSVIPEDERLGTIDIPDIEKPC